MPEKLQESNNDVKYEEGADVVSGICMGASTLWCKKALKNSFLVNPRYCELEQAKDLTNFFVNKTEFGKCPILERLGNLLSQSGVNWIPAFNPKRSLPELVSYIQKNPGVYLLLGGTHVMAISYQSDVCYFYDVEKGIYSCEPSKLLMEIKNIRPSEFHLTGLYGWYGLRCIGDKHLRLAE